MGQRFVQRLVRIGQVDVLADHRDIHLALRMLERLDDPVPLREVRRRRFDLELAADDLVELFLVEHARDLVDAVGILRRNHSFGRHVGEQRDLPPVPVEQRAIRTAQDDVRLDTSRAIP
jgi:hypothetical protein